MVLEEEWNTTYHTIIQDLTDALPELLLYQEIIDFLNDDEEDYLVYPFYGIFSRILMVWMNSENQDHTLLERCFAFMERMANCEDAAVQTLLRVEVLEVFFSLPYERYIQAERQYMYTETRKLHNENKPSFCEPSPFKQIELREYRTRKEKKAEKKERKKHGNV